MECAICGKNICCHGSHQVSGQVWKCLNCGSVGINGPANIYCLPTYEGKVNAATDVFSTVCRECYGREVKNL